MKRFFSVLVISAVLVSALSITVLADGGGHFVDLRSSYKWDDASYHFSWEASPFLYRNVSGVYSQYQTGTQGLQRFDFIQYYFSAYYPDGSSNYNSPQVYRSENDLDGRPFFVMYKSDFDGTYSDPMYSINFMFDLNSSVGDMFLNTVPYGTRTTYRFTIYLCCPDSNYSWSASNFSGFIDYYYCKQADGYKNADFLTPLGSHYYRAAMDFQVTPLPVNSADINFMRDYFGGYLGSSSTAFFGNYVIPSASESWYTVTCSWTVDNSPTAPASSGWQYEADYPYLTTRTPNYGTSTGIVTYTFPRGTTTSTFCGNQPFYVGLSSIRFLAYDSLTLAEQDAAQLAVAYGQNLESLIAHGDFTTNMSYYQAQLHVLLGQSSSGLAMFRNVFDTLITIPYLSTVIFSLLFVTIALMALGFIKKSG